MLYITVLIIPFQRHLLLAYGACTVAGFARHVGRCVRDAGDNPRAEDEVNGIATHDVADIGQRSETHVMRETAGRQPTRRGHLRRRADAWGVRLRTSNGIDTRDVSDTLTSPRGESTRGNARMTEDESNGVDTRDVRGGGGRTLSGVELECRGRGSHGRIHCTQSISVNRATQLPSRPLRVCRSRAKGGL
ncbi:hypothetical protein DFH09DRAFT_1234354 [Mycena vulgaris]|nr:hypothetical protein DFH09DRAFT_1234354 [Mycena vulgaris]